MTHSAKIRLDEILLRQGTVSEPQIRDALLRQKMQGGKLGSQLLYHRYIDEATLVKALATQFGCEGVILGGLKIPESVIKFIPSRLALTRMVMPFDFDPQTQTIKIACEDPNDPNLINEINFALPGKKPRLYIAAELALDTAISKYYLGKDTELSSKLLVEIPDLNSQPDETQSSSLREITQLADGRKTVLVVTDEEYSGSLLESLLGRDGYEVKLCGSTDEAIELLSSRAFHAALVKKAIDNKYDDLMNRLREASPKVAVRVFTSSSALLLDDETLNFAEDILRKNLSLLTSLQSSKGDAVDGHGALVGKYVEKLCRRMGVPAHERMLVAMAAYLHDITGCLAKGDDPKDYRATIESSKKLLESFGYPAPVIEILGLMYKDLPTGLGMHLPFELLSANIITTVDLFCENVLFDRHFTLERFDAVKKRLRDFSGKLFWPEVVEAFIAMIQEEILNLQTLSQTGQIIIYTDDAGSIYPLILRLKNEGFRVLTEASPERLELLCRRSLPDLLLIRSGNAPEKIGETIGHLVAIGIDLSSIPAIFLADSSAIARMAPLLDKGLEDIVAVDSGHELLIGKIRRLIAQKDEMQQKAAEDKTAGARGRLADMNIIDLIQGLAPGLRTVKITIAPADSNREKLVIYLNKGSITYAELGPLKGADAVYEGMSWADGIWVVEPLKPEEIPASNNNASNDSILMEGAFRLDEKMKAGKL